MSSIEYPSFQEFKHGVTNKGKHKGRRNKKTSTQKGSASGPPREDEDTNASTLTESTATNGRGDSLEIGVSCSGVEDTYADDTADGDIALTGQLCSLSLKDQDAADSTEDNAVPQDKVCSLDDGRGKSPILFLANIPTGCTRGMIKDHFLKHCHLSPDLYAVQRVDRARSVAKIICNTTQTGTG